MWHSMAMRIKSKSQTSEWGLCKKQFWDNFKPDVMKAIKITTLLSLDLLTKNFRSGRHRLNCSSTSKSFFCNIKVSIQHSNQTFGLMVEFLIIDIKKEIMSRVQIKEGTTYMLD